jgi:hypothetical protein
MWARAEWPKPPSDKEFLARSLQRGIYIRFDSISAYRENLRLLKASSPNTHNLLGKMNPEE